MLQRTGDLKKLHNDNSGAIHENAYMCYGNPRDHAELIAWTGTEPMRELSSPFCAYAQTLC